MKINVFILVQLIAFLIIIHLGILGNKKVFFRKNYLNSRDFPFKKIFDMKINFKGASFVLPQYGVYQQ
jgi:hypothetical protein